MRGRRRRGDGEEGAFVSFGVAYQRGNVVIGEESIGEDFGLGEAEGWLDSPI